MLIIKVANGMGNDLPEGEDGYKRIVRRIEILVNEGRLIAQGDIKNWRFSEVRLRN